MPKATANTATTLQLHTLGLSNISGPTAGARDTDTQTASLLSNRRNKCSHANNKDQIEGDWLSKQTFLENVLLGKDTNKNLAFLGGFRLFGIHRKVNNSLRFSF